MSDAPCFVVAGHLCVDLVPDLTHGWPQPGGLMEAGSLHFSSGGAVANVGSALWRLGYQVRLVALVGQDRLGEISAQLLQPLGEQPAIRIAPGQSTSYSIVIAPRDCDRAFLQSTGANAVFTSADVRDEDLDGAAWLHFGYPPRMPAIAADGGRELANLFRRARQRGLRTSLDLCAFGNVVGSTDWQTVLRNCARWVTVFAPSIGELRAALRQPPRQDGDIEDSHSLAHMLFAMGFTIVAIKLGTRGIYLATTDASEDLAGWGFSAEWHARELLAPSFKANFVNAIGAGDCAIAGFIASAASGDGPEQALTIAAATGASSVEAADASGGVPSMEKLQARMSSGWERIESCAPGNGWTFDPHMEIWKRAGDT